MAWTIGKSTETAGRERRDALSRIRATVAARYEFATEEQVRTDLWLFADLDTVLDYVAPHGGRCSDSAIISGFYSLPEANF